MKKHNFNAGPSILPRIAIENSAKAILDLNGIGLSLLEISHRSKDFQAIIDETMDLFKELLNIPSGYQVIFLGGGASLVSQPGTRWIVSKRVNITSDSANTPHHLHHNSIAGRFYIFDRVVLRQPGCTSNPFSREWPPRSLARMGAMTPAVTGSAKMAQVTTSRWFTTVSNMATCN